MLNVSFSLSMNHVEYVSKNRFARGRANKESIDTLQLNEVLGIGLRHWASIQNLCLLSDLLAAVIVKPLSDHLDGFLGLIC